MAPSRESCLLWAPPGWRPEAVAPVFGLHLVERVVLAFRAAGVARFLVGGDPDAARWVVERLAGGRLRGVSVRRAGELGSLVAEFDGPAGGWVARADCMYDRRLVSRFVDETRSANGSVAAVDFRADALATQDGAPRISGFEVARDAPAEGDAMRVAGQGLLAPAGVLVGLVRARAGFARALEDAPPELRSLENALSLLARREPVATWAAAEHWQLVRAAAVDGDLALARRKVLAGAVRLDDGIVARYVNRPISRRISERLLGRNVRPWQISVASFAATLAAGLAFAVGHAATGGLIAQFAAVLDGVDEEVAGAGYQDSPFGGVYDALLDRVGDAALIGGMTLYAWLMGAGNSAVALGFAAVAGSSLSMLVKEKYGTQFRRPWASEREGRWSWLLLGRDGRLFLALVAGMTGYVEAVLAYLAVGTHFHAGVRLYRIRSEAFAGSAS
jgi:CDP-diacylglycerol--glycerol-3-phosphate 3-phosphatidyltransferase